MNAIMKFLKDEEGATAIEYGLLAALISIAIIVAAGTVGDNLDLVFQRIATALTAALAP